MDLDNLSTDDLVLIGRSLSIHRASVRKKLGRLNPSSREYGSATAELDHVDRLLGRINRADSDRLVSPEK
jgi:hypothetical protein